MRLRSIRSRTLVLVLGVLCIALTLISWRSYSDARHEIEELFDAYLAHAARLLEGMVGGDLSPATRLALQEALDAALQGGHGVGESAAPLDGHRYETKLAFLVLDNRGQPLLRSASAPPALLERLLEQLPDYGAGPASGEREPLSVLAPQLIGYHTLHVGENYWRVFLRQDVVDRHWILVAEREDVRGELVGSITLRSLLPDLIGLPLLALLVWSAIGLGLRPLEQVVRLIKARDAENLAPLTLAPLPQELEPMVAALNRLLQQVTSVLEREKRFLADAAHELRTPLAVLRIHAQNALEAPEAADRAAALQQLKGGVDRATRVVTQMLTLARLAPDALQVAMAELDLARYVREELAELIPLALEREQELVLDYDETADYRLVADAPSLGTLLQNLVGNAVQYTPLGGQIAVRLLAETPRVGLRIADSGPGVPAEQREQLFRRFYRQGAGQGAGLGLSIVQRIVELHGGEILLDKAALGGLEVTVWLPRKQPAAVARQAVAH
ncbi:sensor histidine kinase N-terminal domain-containing protein [Pseudomonas sp. MAP12]|uniref:histidine kinase n=1 Tax=Geopseudomonas aromaticivorans TaxID=2849492 RepID=A0ABS6MSJ2_9GAMM|nr:ATP-binding protein [Pseudomonas aromaticivorans]MBV2131520.1 sensor histidine kinase N-terminal domain-containing protein [Pseudomonas aromaticivorans]